MVAGTDVCSGNGSTKQKPQWSKRITSARRRKGLSVDDLARETGIKFSTLGKKLRAETEFTITELAKIGKALGYPDMNPIIYGRRLK